MNENGLGKEWTTVDENGIVRDLKKELRCSYCGDLYIVGSYRKSYICFFCLNPKMSRHSGDKNT